MRIRVIRGEIEFSGQIDIIKLQLQNWPRGGVDKTPVFDSAAGGFVYVYGRSYLKKPRPAILSRFALGLDHGRIDDEKSPPSISIAGR